MRYSLLVVCACAASCLAGQVITVDAGERDHWTTWPSFDTLFVEGSLDVDLVGRPPARSGLVRVLPRGSLSVRDASLAFAPPGNAVAVLVAPAARFSLHGVSLEYAGDSSGVLLDLRGDSARISRSSLRGPGRLLSASGSALRVSRTEFHVDGGIGVVLAPAGLARGARLSDCDFEVGGGGVGVRGFSPYHLVADTRLRLAPEATGVHLEQLDAYRYYDWGASPFDGASGLRRVAVLGDAGAGEPGTAGATGVIARAFQGGPGLTLEDCTLTDLALGAELRGSGIHVVGGDYRGNRCALATDRARLRGVSIAGGTGEAVGVVYASSSEVEIRVEGCAFASLATAIRCEAPVGRGSSLSRVRFEDVGERFGFAPGATGKIDLEVAPTSDPPAAPGAHAGHDHGSGHPTASPSQVLAHGASLIVSPSCTPPASPSQWYTCPVAATGTLHVATGDGLSDPVHEHEHPLGPLGVSNVRTATHGGFDVERAQTGSVRLAGGESYALSLPESDHYYDLYLRWEGERAVDLAVDYPHDSPVVFHALGRGLPRVGNLAELARATTSSYFVDTIGARVVLRLYPAQGGEEVVVYAGGVDIPVTVRDTALHIEHGVAAGAPDEYAVKLTGPVDNGIEVSLTDLYGTPLGPVSSSPDRTGTYAFDLPSDTTEGGWVWVRRGAQLWKGPLLLRAP